MCTILVHKLQKAAIFALTMQPFKTLYHVSSFGKRIQRKPKKLFGPSNKRSRTAHHQRQKTGIQDIARYKR